MRNRLGIIVVALATVLGVCPAHATGEVGLSWDGVTWADTLERSLFDESILWVPGDERTNSFFVRNQATAGASVSISVVSPDLDRLIRDEDIHLVARVDDGAWIGLERIGADHQINESVLLAGEVSRVQVRATFDPAATNQSQRSQVSLGFRVSLTDARVATGGGRDKGPLPNAGTTARGWELLLAGLLVGTGLAMVRRRGKEQPDG